MSEEAALTVAWIGLGIITALPVLLLIGAAITRTRRDHARWGVTMPRPDPCQKLVWKGNPSPEPGKSYAEQFAPPPRPRWNRW